MNLHNRRRRNTLRQRLIGLRGEQLESRLLMCNNVSGVISSSQVWNDTAQPYCVVGDVIVQSGVTLSIVPGVRVDSPGQFNEIFVQGELIADGAQFTGQQTELVAESGGTIQLTNGTSVTGDQVRFDAGSFGTVSDSIFSTAKLRVFTSGISAVTGNTFQRTTPIETNPSLVPLFYGTNVYSVAATVDLRGAMFADASWAPHPNLQRYNLVEDVIVGPAYQLGLQSGITINNSGQFFEMFVDGSVNATGVNFTGTETDIIVRSGGTFNLSDSAISGQQVLFEASSAGEIIDNTFNTAKLRVFSSSVSQITGNTFQRTTPIETTPSLVPQFYGTNVYSVNATIDVQGSMFTDATWTPHPNLVRYNLVEDLTIGSAYRLDLAPGISLNNSGQFFEVFVNGIMTAANISFTGTETDVIVRSGGTLDVIDSTIAGQQILYEANSLGSVVDTTFSTAKLRVFTSSLSQISGNSFQRSTPVETIPSLVPRFYGTNTYSVSSTIDLQGGMASDATWAPHPNLRRYNLVEDVTVGSAFQLDILPGITLNNGGQFFELFINGTVNASGVTFTGTEIEAIVRNGGTLNLSNSSVAGQLVVYEAGSQGLITGNTFSTAKLAVFSPSISQISGNSFQRSTPVETTPSLVPRFYGTNVYAVTATIDLQGTTSADATWTPHPNLRRYNLVEDVTIGSAHRLMIQPNVTVNNGGQFFEMFVSGQVEISGVSFTGTQTEMIIRNGGSLQLNSSTVAGEQILFEAGSSGSIVDSVFTTAALRVFSSGVQTISGNTFHSSTPIDTNPSLVPRFYGTNSYLVSASINVSGTMSSDATWREYPNLRRYNVVEDVVVAAGFELIVQPGLIINSTNQFAEVFVDGTVHAYGMELTGNQTEVYVRSGGTMYLDSSRTGSGVLAYQANSRGAVSCTAIGLELQLHSQSTVRAFENDFSFGSVRASGSNTTTINLRNQYWGTTSTSTIEGKIVHNQDNSSLPTVLFTPFLTSPSVICDAPPTATAAIAGSTQWTGNFINAVDGGGANSGNGRGVELVAGASAVRYDDVNRLYVQFSKPVHQTALSNFELRDSESILPFSLSYDPATFMATIALPQPLQYGKYRLAVADAVSDALGNSLDGDSSGQAGGIYNFRFDILPGDANGDNRVSTLDLLQFGSAFNSQIGQSNYSPLLDWNADGRVNTSDLQIFSANFNLRISDLAEPDAPFSGVGGGQSGGYAASFDSYFSDLGEKEDEDDDRRLKSTLEL